MNKKRKKMHLTDLERKRRSDRAIAFNRTHGMKHSRVYRVWQTMKERCTNPHNKSYARYGARGIKVCAEWTNSFENFLRDMGNPETGLSLERINNNGDYCPQNCKWASSLEQANNKRNNKLLEFNGKKQTLAQWSRELNFNYHSIKKRLLDGWHTERAFIEPIKKQRKTNK